MSDAVPPTRLDRRAALKFFATGAVGVSVPAGNVKAEAKTAQALDPAMAIARGTLTDPNLVLPVPSAWPRVLTEPELKTIGVLADIILPADEFSVAATAAGVPEFINEWVSAPYEKQQSDLAAVRSGLGWLNTEAYKQSGKSFVEMDATQQLALVDLICSPEKAKPEHQIGALFFQRFANLCLSGFYSSDAGFEDLRYRGNLPTPEFAGPPPEVLQHLGLV
jgi:hypothetical protein